MGLQGAPRARCRLRHARAPSPSPTHTPQGAEGTVYGGLAYRLSLKFTSEYPFKAPTVRFETPCFHPNVDTYGNICLDILKDKWSGETWGWGGGGGGGRELRGRARNLPRPPLPTPQPRTA